MAVLYELLVGAPSLGGGGVMSEIDAVFHRAASPPSC